MIHRWMYKHGRISALSLACVLLLLAGCTPPPIDPDTTESSKPLVDVEETTESLSEWEGTLAESGDAEESMVETTEDSTQEETESFYWEDTAVLTTTEVELCETTESEEESGTRVVELAPGGYTVDAVITYFHEVVHSSEYSFGTGRANAVHKWTQPIYYQLHGDYTREDMETIREICCKLNAVEGFPGIYSSPNDDAVNLNLYFYDQDLMNSEYGHMVNYEAADGLMTYWYSNHTNEILEALICCRSDVSQGLRNSVIVEEIFNSLGMPNDTKTRVDSILYQYGSAVTEPSELDWLLVRLLYHEKMLCGYDCDNTAAVIRALCAEWTKKS